MTEFLSFNVGVAVLFSIMRILVPMIFPVGFYWYLPFGCMRLSMVPFTKLVSAMNWYVFHFSLAEQLYQVVLTPLAARQATLLENDSTKAKQLSDRWTDATKEFISYASRYEVESFLAARQAVLTDPVTATFSVEDFFPSFLETQVYQQSLFGDFRQLNIITFPGKDPSHCVTDFMEFY